MGAGIRPEDDKEAARCGNPAREGQQRFAVKPEYGPGCGH